MNGKETTPASSVESKIAKVVDTMGNLTYIFDNWHTANFKLDRITLPAVINVLPVSGVLNVTDRKLRDFPARFY